MSKIDCTSARKIGMLRSFGGSQTFPGAFGSAKLKRQKNDVKSGYINVTMANPSFRVVRGPQTRAGQASIYRSMHGERHAETVR
jgi:hypothetical protein